jgi:hypothetical protein
MSKLTKLVVLSLFFPAVFVGVVIADRLARSSAVPVKAPAVVSSTFGFTSSRLDNRHRLISVVYGGRRHVIVECDDMNQSYGVKIGDYPTSPGPATVPLSSLRPTED